MTQYLIVDTSTHAGLSRANSLLARGWKVVRTGLFLVWLSRKS